jgi:hypothetical protein
MLKFLRKSAEAPSPVGPEELDRKRLAREERKQMVLERGPQTFKELLLYRDAKGEAAYRAIGNFGRKLFGLEENQGPTSSGIMARITKRMLGVPFAWAEMLNPREGAAKRDLAITSEDLKAYKEHYKTQVANLPGNITSAVREMLESVSEQAASMYEDCIHLYNTLKNREISILRKVQRQLDELRATLDSAEAHGITGDSGAKALEVRVKLEDLRGRMAALRV